MGIITCVSKFERGMLKSPPSRPQKTLHENKVNKKNDEIQPLNQTLNISDILQGIEVWQEKYDEITSFKDDAQRLVIEHNESKCEIGSQSSAEAKNSVEETTNAYQVAIPNSLNDCMKRNKSTRIN